MVVGARGGAPSARLHNNPIVRRAYRQYAAASLQGREMEHAGNGIAAGQHRGARPGLVLLIASVATFLDFLDVTVVNIAFPSLQREFSHTTLSALSWVVTGYAIVFAALLTPAGRLADVVGRRRVFLTGVSGFTLASVLAAVAPSVPVLIVARA